MFVNLYAKIAYQYIFGLTFFLDEIWDDHRFFAVFLEDFIAALESQQKGKE